MPYRMVAQVAIQWVGPGAGPMEQLTAANLPIAGAGAQQLELSTGSANVVPGTGSGTFPFTQIASADITTLLTALTTDISAQFNLAANLAKMQGWATGNP